MLTLADGSTQNGEIDPMAKAIKPQKALEDTLFEACNKLRGTVEPGEYKHIVLGLVFLKYAGDRFEQKRRALIEAGEEWSVDMPAAYGADNIFYLPTEARWQYLVDNAKQSDIALKVDKAMELIEDSNSKTLSGALPIGTYTRLNLDSNKLGALLDEIDKIDTLANPDLDIFGRVYEYFLQKFAINEGQGKGEYYTPKCIVNLIAEMIEPYKGTIYDPCCGSGGMFVQCMRFIEAHKGRKEAVTIKGQEATPTTYKLAKMNLAIRGISADLGQMPADTFHNDQHKHLKADFIMANPPFNQKDWRDEKQLTTDPRWYGYEVPPVSNANYGWILNMHSKLSANGVAGFLLANGALNGGGQEYKIRKQLIENNVVEAIIVLPRDLFYSTDISVTLWILNNNKKARKLERGSVVCDLRDREGEILFIDLRTKGAEFEKKYIALTSEEIAEVTTLYHRWQQDEIENIPEFCYVATSDEVKAKDYTLVPSSYIEFVDRDRDVDFHTEMLKYQKEFAGLVAQELQAQQNLLTAFKELGYGIE